MKKYLTYGIGAILVAGLSITAIADEDREYTKKSGAYFAETEYKSSYKEHENGYKEHHEKERYEHEDEEREEHRYTNKQRLMGYKPIYVQECGSCHMAYQPEFLPKRSWIKMMKNLDDHFQTDATLDKDEYKKIYEYLVANAADSKSVGGEYEEIADSIKPNETPLRISDTPYFKKEHRKISKELIAQKEVKSIANCTACHKEADRGSYDENEIIIPNYGRWDD